MCAVIIHECHVGYAFKIEWNNTDSWHGVAFFFSAKVPMKSRLKRVILWVKDCFFFLNMFIGNAILVCV